MKIRILDRVMVFVAGLLLIAGCVALVAQVLFQQDVAGMIGDILSKQSTLAKIVFVLTALILLALGGYCVLMLFRRPGRNDKYILQKTETGELEISLETLENLVRKCLEQHPEVDARDLTLENQRDGLEIRISGNVAGGVSIPLTIDTLQKQIKQYVTACSGLEVRNIRVQIDATGDELKGAPFAIEPPAGIALLRDGDAAEKTESSEVPAQADEVPDIPEELSRPAEDAEPDTVQEEPVVSPIHSMQDSGIVVDDPEEDDDRPIHQRLFSNKSEPCIVPVPPEMENSTEETAEKQAEETVEKQTEKTVENPPEEATGEGSPAESGEDSGKTQEANQEKATEQAEEIVKEQEHED